MIGMVGDIGGCKAALPIAGLGKGADSFPHGDKGAGRSFRRFPDGFRIELPIQSHKNQARAVLRHAEGASVHMPLEDIEASAAEGPQHRGEALCVLLLEQARHVLKGEEVDGGAGVQLLQDAGELQRKAMPWVVFGAVSCAAKALTRRAADDSDRSHHATSQGVKLGRIKLCNVADAPDPGLLRPVVIVGFYRISADVDRNAG